MSSFCWQASWSNCEGTSLMSLLLALAVTSRHTVTVRMTENFHKHALVWPELWILWCWLCWWGVLAGLEKIWVRSDFSHVTLACDDGSIQAHKVISRGHSSSILNAALEVFHHVRALQEAMHLAKSARNLALWRTFQSVQTFMGPGNTLYF